MDDGRQVRGISELQDLVAARRLMHLTQAAQLLLSQLTRTGSCFCATKILLSPVTAILTPLAVDSSQEGGFGNTQASLTPRIMESARQLEGAFSL